MMVRKLSSFFALSLFSATVFAQMGTVNIVGSQLVSVPLNAVSGLNQKWVTLQTISLSPEAKAYLAKHSQDIYTPTQSSAPSKVSLGMNNVPVLDQGIHGTCATFATTAALDAAYGKGDFISQLCNLELGSYLASQDSSYYSGWDGTWDLFVAQQITKYGAISTKYQMSQGCAGVKKYPAYSTSQGNAMLASDFTQHSVDIMNTVSYKVLLAPPQAMSENNNVAQVLNKVKKALVAKQRVIFGVLLDVNYGGVGAFGKNVVDGDTWILTPEIKRDAQKGTIHAGHAMVITGYDDNLVVTGPNNLQQKGVLTLRNSWGTSAGNRGEYYMTYDYFKLLVLEALKVKGNK